MENESGLKLLFWVSTSVILLLTLSIVLFSLIYRKNIYIQKQKESENLLKASLESEKRERQRIASDIHDSISGDLNAIRNYVTFLDQTETDSSKKPVFKEVKSALDNLLKDVQDISYNLMPPMLESLGLIATLEDYFDRISKWNSITITSQYYKRDLPISSSDSYELYRIIQEFISNMIKHGSVSNIDCNIKVNEENIEISIIDNGIPFEYFESLKSTSGMGLKNILSRTKLINAMLIQVPAEEGNVIEIHLKKRKC